MKVFTKFSKTYRSLSHVEVGGILYVQHQRLTEEPSPNGQASRCAGDGPEMDVKKGSSSVFSGHFLGLSMVFSRILQGVFQFFLFNGFLY